MEEVRLPDLPSELIRLAIEDLQRCAAMPEYELCMESWHTYRPAAMKCDVCLAGAVMAMHLYVPLTEGCSTRQFDRDTSRKLLALDDFRRGNVWRGLSEIVDWDNSTYELIYERFPAGDYEVRDYAACPEGFVTDMLAMADELQRLGF